MSASVTDYRGHCQNCFFLPGIISLFVMCIGIIWSKSLLGGPCGRAGLSFEPGSWSCHGPLHKCVDHWATWAGLTLSVSPVGILTPSSTWFQWTYMVPRAHLSQPSKPHLSQFSRSCMAHERDEQKDRHTDHATASVASNYCCDVVTILVVKSEDWCGRLPGMVSSAVLAWLTNVMNRQTDTQTTLLRL